jgi:hypothetical protein
LVVIDVPGLLETLVLDHLRPKGQSWWLPPVFRRRLHDLLQVAFSRTEVPFEEVTRLLKLVAVLEEDSAYGDVAEQLIEMLRSIPQAVVRIEAMRGRAAVSESHRDVLSRFVASERNKKAPRIDDRPIAGVRLKDLRPTSDPMEMRARRPTRRESDVRGQQRHRD